MTLGWYVAVAEHRRDEVAEFELAERGFLVHIPRQWQREKTLLRKLKTTYELLTSPYFFVKFDGADDEQYSLVIHARGVSHVLETKPQVPGSIPVNVIDDHRERERAERANLIQKKSLGRRDLVLREMYMVIRHELFRGQSGKLVAASRGVAHLDCDGKIVTLPDCDIEIALKQMRTKGTAA